jgi:hypothetical protein
MIEINELVLRVPGMGEEEGRLLGNEVAEKLAQALPPAHIHTNVDEINLSIPGNWGGGRSVMANSIVQQILTQLNNR